MANKTKVTYSDVERAIHQLETDGEEVTIRAVRAITGGATDVVSRLIREVMNNRLEAGLSRSAIGDDVIIALNRMINGHVAKAVSLLERHLEQAKRFEAELQEDVQALEACNLANAEELAALRLEVEQGNARAEAERVKAAAEVAALAVQLSTRTSDIEIARQELLATNSEVSRLKHLDATVSELKSQLAQAQSDLRAAESRAAAAEACLGQYQQLVRLPAQAKEASTKPKTAA